MDQGPLRFPSTESSSASITTDEDIVAFRQAQTLVNKLLALLTCIEMHTLSMAFPLESQRDFAQIVRRDADNTCYRFLSTIARGSSALPIPPFQYHASADVWVLLTYFALLKVGNVTNSVLEAEHLFVKFGRRGFPYHMETLHSFSVGDTRIRQDKKR